MNIFCALPNDLIMNIIKEADGGRYAHQKKYNSCLDVIVDTYQEALEQTTWVADVDDEDEFNMIFEDYHKEARCGHVIFKVNVNYHFDLGLA